MDRAICRWAGLAMGMTLCPWCAGGTAVFTPLGDLPGGEFYSTPMDVSDDGNVVVGWSRANSQISGQFRAFRWTQATGMELLGHLGATNSNGMARAVSGDGMVIIGDAGGPFRWTQGAGMVLLGSGTCMPLDLSFDGSIIVGWCPANPGMQAALWTQSGGWTVHGAMGTDPVDAFFSGVSADGIIACGQSMIKSPNVEPIRWTARDGMSALGDVPGGFHYALAWAISADGSTIVGDAIGDVGLDAFRWTQSGGLQNVELAAPGVTESTLQDVNGDGLMAVGYANNGINAMMWDQAHGMRSVQQILADDHGLTLSGWTLLGAIAISADGRAIVGHGTNPTGDIEAWLVLLPEPIMPGDVNGDGVVNIQDLLLVIANWGATGPPGSNPADVDGSGVVNIGDLLFVISHWNP